MTTTKEPQYQRIFELANDPGIASLGLMANQMWHDDPRRFAFVCARYKFVAKMLSGARSVLEAGCGDAFFSRIVQQEVKEFTAVDFDPSLIRDAENRMTDKWRFRCLVHDMCDKPLPESFDGVFALDVLEHIEPARERAFIGNMVDSLATAGTLIIGVPTLESQAFASPQSKAGHVNCKSAPVLKKLLGDFFTHVLIFSMNDEVVHTGFHGLAHYLFAVCSGKKPAPVSTRA